MADKRIDQLDAAAALAGTEPVPVYQGGTTKQTTAQEIADLAEPAASAVSYSNATSGLTANNAQAAIDELAAEKQDTLVAGTNITIVGTTISATGGGGLTHFTESVNTSSPNATVPVVQLLATNAATNVDVALTTKGTGAILAQVPDGTAVGGNKRGINCVDLQTSRSNASQVAGNYSLIAGRNNTATSGSLAVGDTNSAGTNSIAVGQSNAANGSVCVALGSGNSASSSVCIAIGSSNSVTAGGGVAIGSSSTASGSHGIAIGQSNTASGERSVAFGRSNTASGAYSWIPGGWSGSTRSLYGASAWTTVTRAAVGDNQHIGMVSAITTTGATATVLTSDRGNVSTSNVMTLPNNSLWTGIIMVGARDTSGNTASWFFSVNAKRGANAAATSVPSVGSINSFVDPALSGITCNVVADTTRGAVVIEVVGLAATTIDWCGEYFGVQIAR